MIYSRCSFVLTLRHVSRKSGLPQTWLLDKVLEVGSPWSLPAWGAWMEVGGSWERTVHEHVAITTFAHVADTQRLLLLGPGVLDVFL